MRVEGPRRRPVAFVRWNEPRRRGRGMRVGSSARLGDDPVFRVARLDERASVRLLSGYEAELVGLGIVLDRDEGGGVDAEEMVAPRGTFLHVEIGPAIVACGGVRRLDDEIAEIKRMYVAPIARRRGVASALLARLEDEARALGCRAVRLDTGRHMVGALALYRTAGYHEIPDYNGNPHAGHWMEKAL